MPNPTVLNTSKLGSTKDVLPDAVQGSRDTVTIYWYYPDGTAVTLTSATITGVYRDTSTGSVYAADGVFAVTDGANGIFTWAYGAGDVGTAGKYFVQLKAVLADTTVIYSSLVSWDVEENLSADTVAAGVLVGVTSDEAAWLTAAEATGNALTDYLPMASILDEDDMASDDDTYPATQQSVKAYVDSGGGGAINNLSDVTITTPADNEVLAYDGVDTWVNQTAAEAGLAAAAHATAHTDGTDDIQDATAVQKGLATATQITKLDAIEAAADVTDATNVNAAGAVMEADYNANTVLAANSDDTPAPVTVAEQTVVGRITSGNIKALSVAELQTLANVEDGADVTDATNVDAAGATMNTDADVSGNTWTIDEDNMASNLDTKVPSQQSVKAYADTMLPLAGGTMSGDIAMADNNINRAVLKDYGEEASIVAASGATETIDLETANYWKVTLTANCTFTFSNPPASGTVGSFTLKLMQDGTGTRTVTWPASVDWAAGTAPTLTTTPTTGKDILTFFTDDGGTTWEGFVAGLDMS